MVSQNLAAFLADTASHIADPRDRLAYDRQARQLVEQVRLLEQRKSAAPAPGAGSAPARGRCGVTGRTADYARFDDFDQPDWRGGY